ncbi:hypothetical protein ACFSQQ_21185 [Mesorhizobium kowhaii]|jgi:hypothetical protein|uniref:hypothetical protein n=1 Tax=Mesorhizobium kowhaii TaxID=1300272 RepID=UPI00142E06C1|nr:hypothetical protein [Mesorhizobium kowhaii]
MLAGMTFVAWLLPGQFGEFNRLDFKVGMAQIGKRNSPSTDLDPEAAPAALRSVAV